MNRQNFLGHLALAVTLILIAAFAGQIRHWQREWHSRAPCRQAVLVGTGGDMPARTRAEVIVRFRSGTSLAQMKSVAARFNDRLEDQYEFVDGEALMEDLDGETAEQVASEYSALSDLVEYAEPNYQISLDPTESRNQGPDVDGGDQALETSLSDPMFG